LKSEFVDLSTRLKFRVTGADRERFLNGQLTNDVRKATETYAIAACVLSAKGKLNAHVFLFLDAESFILDSDPELRESLLPRFERYIIADDVQIEDVTERLSIFHLISSIRPELPNEWKVRSATRFGQPGQDIWVDRTRHEEVFQRLSEQFVFCDADCAEIFRIEQGLPRWGRELTEEIIPIEANLETETIDYEKGCYIGQEVISRMKMSGQTNKRLCGLISLSGAPLKPGMKLLIGAPESKEVGWITSNAHNSRLHKEIGLGFVKRGSNSVGTRLEAGESEQSSVPVEIVDLPFVQQVAEGV
jgi:folate-binding protein YgfZ